MNATIRAAAVALAVLGLPGPIARASAQERAYVQASVFADIRQFGSTSIDSGLASEPFSRDATGIGGSVRVGKWLHPH